MTLEETGELLAHAALVDNRKTDPAIVIAWHSILGDLRYADCEEAVRAHYAESSDWLMPAHVRNCVRDIRQQRIQDADIPAPPPEGIVSGCGDPSSVRLPVIVPPLRLTLSSNP